MTVKYSEALLNQIMGGASVREVLSNFVLDVYDGIPPTNPEDARIGTKLARYTLNGAAVAATDRSTAQSYLLTIAAGNLSAGKTVKALVTVDGVGTTYVYTLTSGDTTEALVNLHVSQMLDNVLTLDAICDPTTPAIWAQCLIPGLALTIADAGGDKTITPTAKTAMARVNTLLFGPPAAASTGGGGVISKPVGDIWQCASNLAGGTAGYFTLCTPDDTGALDSSFVYKRVQGTLSNVGGDGTIDPVTMTAGAVSTVLSFSLTLPTSKT